MNLIKRVFENNEDKAREVSVKKFMQTLITLSEREQKVLRLRFEELKTLKDSGKELEITQERVRQIEAKAMRKLRHPLRTTEFMTVSTSEMIEQKKRYDELLIQYDMLRKAFEAVTKEKVESSFIAELVDESELLKMPIENLEFSVRTYNCLKRASKDTLEDITNMYEYELRLVRNLGAKSTEEVLQTLKKYNLKLKGDKYIAHEMEGE